MRTIKTTVAVMLSLAIFLPLEALGTAEGTRFIDQLGPFYACIASIVCMQSSVGATWKQGGSRLLGTLIGGLLGLLCVSVTTYWGHPVVLVLVCGVGTLACIYLCNVLNRPSACAISAIVCCSIMLSHSGQERYFYTVAVCWKPQWAFWWQWRSTTSCRASPKRQRRSLIHTQTAAREIPAPLRF